MRCKVIKRRSSMELKVKGTYPPVLVPVRPRGLGMSNIFAVTVDELPEKIGND
jgi:hypothetical protein